MAEPLGLLYAFGIVHQNQQSKKALATLKKIAKLKFQTYDYYIELWNCFKKARLSCSLLKYVLEHKIYIPYTFKSWLLEQIYQHRQELNIDLADAEGLIKGLLNHLKVLTFSESDLYIPKESGRLILIELLEIALKDAIKAHNIEEAHSKAAFFESSQLILAITGEKFVKFIKIACRSNNVSLVELLLREKTISYKLHSQLLTYACFYGHQELEFVLRKAKIFFALKEAIQDQKVEEAENCAKKLIALKGPPSYFSLEPCLPFFCRYSNIDFFKTNALDIVITGEKFFDYIKIACRYNNFALVELLLKERSISAKLHNLLLQEAALLGHQELELVLLKTKRK